MMATLSGAAVSGCARTGRVVSGVGGQYNFVAQAHELPDARSVLMLRSHRMVDGEVRSGIVKIMDTLPFHAIYAICLLPNMALPICVAKMTVTSLKPC